MSLDQVDEQADGRPLEERPPQTVIDHIGLEVTDLERSLDFYDAIFACLGVRRVHTGESAVAYGYHSPVVWIVERGRGPASSFGHLAINAAGRRAVEAAYEAGLDHGGTDCGAPGERPHYGRNYFAAYLNDPDGYRVELVSGSH